MLKAHYSDWKYIMGCGCSRANNTSDIQNALIQHGYNIKVNGRMDGITRKALIDFQKTHHLPIGRLDAQTLNKLCPFCGSHPMIVRIQRKLISFGYNLKVNNKFDKATEDALFHFQKLYGLNVGQLDFKTLKMLGLAY